MLPAMVKKLARILFDTKPKYWLAPEFLIELYDAINI
jgi:hypothetical protein